MARRLYSIVAETKILIPVQEIQLIAHFVKWLVTQDEVHEADESLAVIDGKHYTGQQTLSSLKMIWDLSQIRPVTASLLSTVRIDDKELTLWLEINEERADLSFHDPATVPAVD